MQIIGMHTTVMQTTATHTITMHTIAVHTTANTTTGYHCGWRSAQVVDMPGPYTSGTSAISATYLPCTWP